MRFALPSLGNEMEMFGVLVLIVIVIIVWTTIAREKEKERAHVAYQAALAALKKDPASSDKRQRALLLGRVYSNLMRDKKGNTIFDEVALMNDIGAACAGANQPATAPAAPVQSGDSVETRLTTLQSLREKGLIDADDFARRKREIMDLI